MAGSIIDDENHALGAVLTPRSALGPDREDTLDFGRYSLRVKRPTNTQALLDHPDIHNAFAADEYLPYWPELWPASRMLAGYLTEADDLPPVSAEGAIAIELGCGLGLPGLMAMVRGFRVTFTDYDALALEYALANATLNGLTGADALFLDWRKPPEGLRFPLVLGSDLLYEPGKVGPLARIVETLLAPGGIALISDPDRGPARRFASELYQCGLIRCKLIHTSVTEPDGKTIAGTIYRVERSL